MSLMSAGLNGRILLKVTAVLVNVVRRERGGECGLRHPAESGAHLRKWPFAAKNCRPQIDCFFIIFGASRGLSNAVVFDIIGRMIDDSSSIAGCGPRW